MKMNENKFLLFKNDPLPDENDKAATTTTILNSLFD